MYGIVNKACKQLILQSYGDKVWQEVERKIDFEDKIFISMDQYPDELTQNIIKTTSAITKLTEHDILIEVGKYWVEYTSTGDYKEIFQNVGTDFVKFLMNLDTLHARVGTIFTQLNPPSFKCSDVSNSSLNLHYFSMRQGLIPMVIGLIYGLGDYFNTEITKISHKDINDDTPYTTHVIFYIQYNQRG